MQVSSVSPAEVKGLNGYVIELPEIPDADETIKVLKNFDDTFIKTGRADNEDEIPKKKSIIETGVSVLAALGVTFLLTKKAYKGVQKISETLMQNAKVQNVVKTVQDKVTGVVSNSDKLKKAGDKLSKTPVIANIKSSAQKVVSKFGKENVVSAAGAVAGTVYLSKADNNHDGVADIAEKGVNVYRGVLEKGGVIADTISVLS